MFKNAKLNEIFAESINKLNKIIEKLDTNTGLNCSAPQPKPETKLVNPKNDIKKTEQNNKNNNKSDAKNIKDENSIFNEVDFRVGKIVSVSEPQESDKLYLLKVDLGEGSLRDIGTGLRKFVPRQELENSYVIVWSNLKPKKLIGNLFSNGMVLSAVNDNETQLELLRPVSESNAGDRVFLEGTESNKEFPPLFNANKFKKIAAGLKTNNEKIASFNKTRLLTSKGDISVRSLTNAQIS